MVVKRRSRRGTFFRARPLAPPPGTSKCPQPLGAPPPPPHLQVPPEVLPDRPEVSDVLQRGFELQRDFLRGKGGPKRLRFAPAQPHAWPRPARPGPRAASPLLPSAGPLPSSSPGASARIPDPRRRRAPAPPAFRSRLTPMAPGSPGAGCGRCFPARRKRWAPRARSRCGLGSRRRAGRVSVRRSSRRRGVFAAC